MFILGQVRLRLTLPLVGIRKKNNQSHNLFSIILDPALYQEVHLIPIFFTLSNCITTVKKLPLTIVKVGRHFPKENTNLGFYIFMHF